MMVIGILYRVLITLEWLIRLEVMRKMGQDVMPGISLEEENPVNVRILAKYHNKMF